jgi:hypothetical protein
MTFVIVFVIISLRFLALPKQPELFITVPPAAFYGLPGQERKRVL